MQDLIAFFTLGLIIGLTGTLAPGPTLIGTINEAVASGWRAGPLVTIGHAIVEIGIVLLIIGGLGSYIGSVTGLISLFGGLALIIFGYLTLTSARMAVIPTADAGISTGRPIIVGMLTSISNPYFWIWWLSIGAALLWSSLEAGLIAGVLFIAGHWVADIGWLTLVSASIHKGRFFLSEREYRLILSACGFFLLIFGFWFLFSFFTLPSSG
ncbi:lysine transporter LysE [Methanocalculus chunghsingensis]|uniref:Lysine transporter LysE n=1 Tax=Methanocalculus chunghsingensis TaxID=156457 RepID=A0A8J7W5F2_9EURY|nr:LysE family transporter [Methanocalculus chunghsingensis]MBR1368031.1 lysine transporter LysE [Methanocalculus chunghsingensis]